MTGSIAVTGWALDDIEVTGVRILRDPVAGEPAGTLVLIGNAVLVDGARPDVQVSFPDAPRNSRAGWGYLMLTNFLPDLGNGTFKLNGNRRRRRRAFDDARHEDDHLQQQHGDRADGRHRHALAGRNRQRQRHQLRLGALTESPARGSAGVAARYRWWSTAPSSAPCRQAGRAGRI